MLKRVIGRLSVALSVKIITGNGKFSDRTTYKGMVLIGDFPPVIGKDFFERDKNLRDPPGLFYRGIFVVTWEN